MLYHSSEIGMIERVRQSRPAHILEIDGVFLKRMIIDGHVVQLAGVRWTCDFVWVFSGEEEPIWYYGPQRVTGPMSALYRHVPGDGFGFADSGPHYSLKRLGLSQSQPRFVGLAHRVYRPAEHNEYFGKM